MKTLHRVTDIKIIIKNNLYGTFYDVENLSYSELEIYIGELVIFEGKKYLVSTIENDCFEKRHPCVFRGKRRISQ